MDLVAEYDYGLAIKGRFRLADGSKTFRWRLRDSREWSGLGKQLTEAELPLYRATELARRYEVLVVEGEAACDACWDHGLAATTVCGGAAQKQFGEALRILESKWVILWPDNDDAGRGLMRRLAEDIDGTAKVVTIAAPVPSKGDAVDYFARGGQPENLIALAKRAAQDPQVEMHGAGGILKLPES